MRSRSTECNYTPSTFWERLNFWNFLFNFKNGGIYHRTMAQRFVMVDHGQQCKLLQRTYAHTHIRTYAHTHIRTCAHTYIRTYAHTHIRPYAHTHIRTYAHAHIRTYVHTYNVLFCVKFAWDFSRIDCQLPKPSLTWACWTKKLHPWRQIWPIRSRSVHYRSTPNSLIWKIGDGGPSGDWIKRLFKWNAHHKRGTWERRKMMNSPGIFEDWRAVKVE